jgi:hypothetical protein
MSCVRIQPKLQFRLYCSCSAYRYPHTAQTGKCTVSLLENPVKKVRAKRGKIVELYGLLDNLESALADDSIDVARSLVSDIKEFLS